MPKLHKNTITVFTDGSCIGNGKHNAPGGIGVHFPDHELPDVSKAYRLGPCTNQKAELYAILTAIRYIRQHFDLHEYRIIIKTDSEYSMNCITKWVNGWIKNNWITQSKRPVANREFIEKIHKYYTTYDIQFVHVDAHTGGSDPDSVANAEADRLATKAAQRMLAQRSTPRKTMSTKKSHSDTTVNQHTIVNQPEIIPYQDYRAGTRTGSNAKYSRYQNDSDIVVELISRSPVSHR